MDKISVDELLRMAGTCAAVAEHVVKTYGTEEMQKERKTDALAQILKAQNLILRELAEQKIQRENIKVCGDD